MKKLKTYFNKHRLLLVLIVFVFYGNTLKNGYALDDNIVTGKENVTAQGIASIPKIFKSYYIDRSKDVKADYRPIVKVSYAIEHELFGVHAAISHFFNVFFYLLGLFLLYNLLVLLLSDYDKVIVFYCVAFFAMMPIHSEVVASLKNRDVLLCFIFCIIGFKNYILFFEAKKKKWLFFILSISSFYLAFLSKFDALPYLAIIPVLLFVKHPKQLKLVFLFVFLFILSFLLFKLTKKGVVEKDIARRFYYYFENPLYFEKTLKYKIVATLNSLGFYINQIVFPFKQCCYYGLDTISVFKLSAHGYVGIVTVPLLIFGLFKSFLKKDYLLFVGLFIFCASVSMYLNLVKPAVGIVADRFAFFSSLGIAIIIIRFVSKDISIKPTLSKNLKLLFGFVFVLFASITISRNKDWNSLESLIKADYTKYPNNAFLNYKQGLNIIKKVEDKNTELTIEQRKNKILEARSLIEKSIAIDSTYAVSQSYLSYVLIYMINDFTSALPHVNSAIKLKESTELFFYKAICLRELKNKDSSEYYLLKCIKRDSSYYNAYNLLMYDYNANKEYPKTINLFKNALEKGVKTIEVYNALGKTYWETKNNAEANIYYKKAMDIDPTNQEAAAMVKRTSINTVIKDSLK